MSQGLKILFLESWLCFGPAAPPKDVLPGVNGRLAMPEMQLLRWMLLWDEFIEGFDFYKSL